MNWVDMISVGHLFCHFCFARWQACTCAFMSASVIYNHTEAPHIACDALMLPGGLRLSQPSLGPGSRSRDLLRYGVAVTDVQQRGGWWPRKQSGRKTPGQVLWMNLSRPDSADTIKVLVLEADSSCSWLLGGKARCKGNG